MAGASSYLPDRYQGIDRESSAYRMLASMGWQEGDGLGAQRQGIRTHIRTKKKFDNSGVGQVEAARRAQDWTADMVNFSAVLGGLQEVVARRWEGAADSSDDDEAQPAPSEAPAALGVPASDCAAAAPRKSSKRRRAVESAGTQALEVQAAAAVAPADAAASAVEASVRGAEPRVTHSGRYAKRARNKRVKGYSATDLAAILGGQGGEGASAGEQRRRVEPALPPAASAFPAPVSAGQSVQSSMAGIVEAAQPRPQVLSDCSSDTTEPVSGGEAAWWHVLFVRGGRVGTSEQEVSRTRSMFSEQDQTDLYNQAQTSKSQGRIGLGQSQQPKKIAGARWKGTKTKLSEVSDDEILEQDAQPRPDERSATPDLQRASDVLPGGATIVWGTAERPDWFRRLQTAGKQTDGGAAALALSAAEEKACRKAARKCLKKAGGSCKFKALQQCALDALDMQDDNNDVAEARRKLVKRYLRHCDTWSIRKGLVTAI